jgi:hypothetical protein
VVVTPFSVNLGCSNESGPSQGKRKRGFGEGEGEAGRMKGKPKDVELFTHKSRFKSPFNLHRTLLQPRRDRPFTSAFLLHRSASKTEINWLPLSPSLSLSYSLPNLNFLPPLSTSTLKPHLLPPSFILLIVFTSSSSLFVGHRSLSRHHRHFHTYQAGGRLATATHISPLSLSLSLVCACFETLDCFMPLCLPFGQQSI